MAALSGALGCASAPPPTLLEDQTRRTAPLPACVLQLPVRRPEATASLRKLKEEQVWKLVFPTFDEETRRLPSDAQACTGARVLADVALKGGEPLRPWPLVPEEGDISFGNGGDRMRVVWLRSHRFADGTMGGALALVRTNERFAELYAVGVFRGTPDHVRLGTERLGGEVVVTTEDDGCARHRTGEACETALNVLLPRRGALVPSVRVATEKVAYVGQGAQGTLEYRLVTTTRFAPDGVHLVEQVRVKNDGGRELRKAESERVFVLTDATLASSDEPLWDRVLPSPATKSPPTPSPAKR